MEEVERMKNHFVTGNHCRIRISENVQEISDVHCNESRSFRSVKITKKRNKSAT